MTNGLDFVERFSYIEALNTGTDLFFSRGILRREGIAYKAALSGEVGLKHSPDFLQFLDVRIYQEGIEAMMVMMVELYTTKKYINKGT